MKRIWRDFYIIVLFVLLGTGLLWVDASNIVVFQSFAIGAFLVAGSHITRRLLFPQLDLQEIAKSGAKDPLGAALVFLGILAFLVSVMWVGMGILK